MLVNPLADFYTRYYITVIAILWATTFSLLILFLPKVHAFFRQRRREKNSFANNNNNNLQSIFRNVSDAVVRASSRIQHQPSSSELISLDQMLRSSHIEGISSNNLKENKVVEVHEVKDKHRLWWWSPLLRYLIAARREKCPSDECFDTFHSCHTGRCSTSWCFLGLATFHTFLIAPRAARSCRTAKRLYILPSSTSMCSRYTDRACMICISSCPTSMHSRPGSTVSTNAAANMAPTTIITTMKTMIRRRPRFLTLANLTSTSNSRRRRSKLTTTTS